MRPGTPATHTQARACALTLADAERSTHIQTHGDGGEWVTERMGVWEAARKGGGEWAGGGKGLLDASHVFVCVRVPCPAGAHTGGGDSNGGGDDGDGNCDGGGDYDDVLC